MNRRVLAGVIAVCTVAAVVLGVLLFRSGDDEPLAPVYDVASASPSWGSAPSEASTASGDALPPPSPRAQTPPPERKAQPTRTSRSPRAVPTRATPPRTTTPPRIVPTSVRQTDPDVVPTYPNCEQMRADHPAGVDSSHPAYRVELDLNLNGFACEPE